MAYTPVTFDESVGRTEPGRARVPEGYYLVECEGFDPTPADYEKTTGIFCKVRIVSGPDSAPGLGVGGRLRDFNAVGKADAQFGLGMTLGAFGQGELAKALVGRSLPTYQHFQQMVSALTQRCQGKRAVALIADQQGASRPFSGIESLYPESDWQTYRQAQVVGAPSAPSAQAPNGPTQGLNMSSAEDLFGDVDGQSI